MTKIAYFDRHIREIDRQNQFLAQQMGVQLQPESCPLDERKRLENIALERLKNGYRNSFQMPPKL